MAHEPARGETGHFLQCATLAEKVGGTGHDRDLAIAVDERVARRLVHLDHAVVVPADDEQRRCPHLREQGVTGQIGPSAARNDGADRVGHRRRDPQRGCRAGARAEQPDREPAGLRVTAYEPHRVPEAFGEEIDVEPGLVVLVLLRREQIEEQGGEAGAAQLGRDELVARRVAAGAAPMREDDDPGRFRR